MSENALKLAVWTREVISAVKEQSSFDDSILYEEFLASHEADLAPVFEDLSATQIEEICGQSLSIIEGHENITVQAALDEAEALILAAPRQQDDSIFYVVLGTISFASLGVVVIGILLASRIKSVKSSTYDIKFSDGVPPVVADIVNTVAGKSPALSRIVDRLKGSE